MKILIIDDEPLDLFIARTVLQGEFEVEGFTSLKDCLIWAQNNDFDAVLIDYYLDTDLHATDVLEALQKLKSGTIKNAFVLSSFVDSTQLKKLKDFGFDGVINKPISLAVIRARLGVVQ
ncbi:response regulator [Chryseolinea sp. T2]|uniref:response regulator n=1 Tax=Chryseolinea sp. T2 TaxID=3129255 RepID=UPI0030777121